MSAAREQAILDRVVFQLEVALARVQPDEIRSVYLGGGTPSVLRDDRLSRLLERLRALLGTVDPQLHEREWTVECNPADVTSPLLRSLAESGVNRLSVGIQSFSDAALAAIGRHGSEHRERCLELIAREWRGSWSADLMIALPGQTVAQLRADIVALLRWNPPHLSVYELTIEPHTVLGHRRRNDRLSRPRLNGAGAYALTTELLQAAGYEHYEIGNYARDGQIGRHNSGYWELRPYLGIGPGAVGTLIAQRSGAEQRGAAAIVATRETTARSFSRFLAESDFGVETEEISAATLLREFWMLGLRTKWGVERARHRELFGVDCEQIIAATVRHYPGLFLIGDSTVALNDDGRRILDTILPDLFLEIDTTQEFIRSARFQ